MMHERHTMAVVSFPSDLEIAQSAPMLPPTDIAAQLGIDEQYVVP
jgi:hypothetical protein